MLAAVAAAAVGWLSGPVLGFLPLAVGGYLALFFTAAAVVTAVGGVFAARAQRTALSACAQSSAAWRSRPW